MRTALALVLVASPAAADIDPETLHFLAGEACAIGPSVLDKAEGLGMDRDALVALGGDLVALGQAEVHRDWTVLASDVCQIRFPDLDGPLDIDSPFVRTYIDFVEVEPEFDQPEGCFIEGGILFAALEETPGLTRNDANFYYITLLAEGVIRGDVRFYGEKVLVTPLGSQVIRGAGCETSTIIPTFEENHRFLSENFDQIIRSGAQALPCEQNVDFSDLFLDEEVRERWATMGNSNVWIGLELSAIAWAANWIEGMDIETQSHGTPRPPLCFYPD